MSEETKEKLTDSEFISSQDLELNTLDSKPSPNIKGSISIKVKKGEKIPKIFIPQFLRYNRNFLANLKYKDGVPILTLEQEKEYQVNFTPIKSFTTKEVVDRVIRNPIKWNRETLTLKSNELKKKFNDWAENEFGKEIVKKTNQETIIAIENKIKSERII